MSCLLSGTVSYCKYSTGNSKGRLLIDGNKTPEDSDGNILPTEALGYVWCDFTTKSTGKQNLNVKKQTNT